MNLTNPGADLFGAARAAVLRVVARVDVPLSGRRIHQLTGNASLRTTQNELNHLTAVGLLHRQRVGPAYTYILNRKHALWPAIEMILSTPRNLTDELSSLARETLRPYATRVDLYGSLARGEAGTESDVDVVIIWDPETARGPRDDARFAFTQAVERFTGNETQVLALEPTELEALRAQDDPLWLSIARDSVPLLRPIGAAA